MRLGVVDVGSNTVHLLIVDAHPGAAPVPATSRKIELRLAEHLGDDDTIDDAGVDALVSFMQESLLIAEDLGVTEMMAFATSAIREAVNGDAVIEAVRERTGIRLEVLTGDDEARLTFLAVRRWFGWSSGRLLVIDIGGGSLEIAAGNDENPDLAFSLPLGAGRLTRDFLRNDPPTADEVRAFRKEVRAAMGVAVGRISRAGAAGHAVATSKTMRSLARIAGAAPSSEGVGVRRYLHRDDLREWVPKLAAMTVAERSVLPGVSPSRAAQLLAGAVVAEAAMDLMSLEMLEIGPWALREGIILRRLDWLQDDWVRSDHE
ncbi:MAG: Ppx/GppA family phosphatase [Actinobacteria bacterium]|uniref:Unannotated protein n=1 Tax=freshwater metagenome TaxID=449393 RepID=A0A6J7L0B3_9ZZZZ|nr:Ppx/GppA family phosphatase [Actinomycetota bacterium]